MVAIGSGMSVKPTSAMHTWAVEAITTTTVTPSALLASTPPTATRTTTPHTVKIGYALDGYLVYGRYTASNQPGIDVDLDLCGGHSHDSYGYHYHPSVETRSGSSQLVSGDYTAYYLGPKKCFKGQVSSISNFYADASKPYTQGGMDVGQPNYDNTLKQYDDVSSRSDYEDLKPCCSMSSSWAASGISFDTTGNTGKDGTTGTGTTGGGTGGTTLGSCSGTDDKGKTCPPDYTADKPCPPGCTTIPAGSTTSGANSGATTTATTASSGSYEYTTANALSYMCGSLDTTGREITCGQGEYPAGNNEGTDASISCSSGTIECFAAGIFRRILVAFGVNCSGVAQSFSQHIFHRFLLNTSHLHIVFWTGQARASMAFVENAGKCCPRSKENCEPGRGETGGNNPNSVVPSFCSFSCP
ncbi:unnamed protein product [Durusdinium trenchii]|uniref:YHYH domain-containing protein n=1 Tax=Durusdinium trenchii TaxID=1381693 RepID=A0ABP0PQQ2_9DINO